MSGDATKSRFGKKWRVFIVLTGNAEGLTALLRMARCRRDRRPCRFTASPLQAQSTGQAPVRTRGTITDLSGQTALPRVDVPVVGQGIKKAPE